LQAHAFAVVAEAVRQAGDAGHHVLAGQHLGLDLPCASCTRTRSPDSSRRAREVARMHQQLVPRLALHQRGALCIQELLLRSSRRPTSSSSPAARRAAARAAGAQLRAAAAGAQSMRRPRLQARQQRRPQRAQVDAVLGRFQRVDVQAAVAARQAFGDGLARRLHRRPGLAEPRRQRGARGRRDFPVGALVRLALAQRHAQRATRRTAKALKTRS
jgi:hypothetical protein